ncbi:MAG: hypothetical protein DRJ01_07425 [Bacteroidetes bacterium]|nr:MAG: hypothetical protein DRJ01_07425 [Bacteroidota bacterium]
MKKVVYIAIIILLTSACASQKVVNSSFSVVNIKNDTSFTQNALIYALPRTVIKVNVEISKIESYRGPYCQYAKKYLGIDDDAVIFSDNVSYDISNIDIESYSEPDTNCFFLVKSQNDEMANLLNLSQNGLLLSINKNIDDEEKYQKTNFYKKYDDDFFFINQSVKRNLQEINKKEYKIVKNDTSTVKIPFTRRYTVLKSTELKAEEAANFIIKIRKRKFKLISGMYEKFPDGEAVERMIKEMDKLENDYLALFIGKPIETKQKYTLNYTPDESLETNQNILFYFSSDNGVLINKNIINRTIANKQISGYPIIIDVENLDFTNKLKSSSEETQLQTNSFFYRIPDYANVRIIKGNNVIASKKMLIAQFGKLASLPKDLINKSKIEFYKDYGSIKSVNK